MTITYKDADGIAGMRVAGRLASEVLDYLTPHVKPGVTTNELDRLAHDYITQVQGAIPAPLNYQPAGYIALPQVDLHLAQPPGLPRHSERQAAEKRRHR
jgi:methionyl aminopeptidase